jgi:hypothetical protein
VAQQRREDIYIQAGETAKDRTHFSADRIAAAFGIERERVVRALMGEFGLGPDGLVDAQMAQRLAEVLLADFPMDERQAALMQLGGFTPRHDASEGIGDGPPAEESDRQAAVAGIPDDELASRRSSHDPATNDAI